MKVADYLAKYLRSLGMTYIYGYIGGAVTHLVDSIYREPGLTFMPCYHEQAAAFGACAAAKYSGCLRAALATSGPGATNLITGIADAYFDSAPVLFLTGQVNTYDFKYRRAVRQFGFQETDIVSIVRPITKYSVLLDQASRVKTELKRAAETALAGRPGPVLVDLPMDVQRSEISPPGRLHAVAPDSAPALTHQDLEQVCDLLANAKRPLILAGGGCRISGACGELLYLAEMLSLPVVVSLMGKDCFPHDHRLYAGFIGAYGNRYGSMALTWSDLVLVLGSRLDSRQIGNLLVPFRDKKIIQVDIDEAEIGQRLPVTKGIVSDVRGFLTQLLALIGQRPAGIQARTGWLSMLAALQELFPPLREPLRAGVDNFHYQVMDAISRYLQCDDIICADVGQNQMLAAQVLRIRGGQRFINSGGMAPMGYALPAAVAIALENERRVVVIAGDGGIQMNIQELNTLGSMRLPVLIFVFNNRALGMIQQFQSLYFNNCYCATGAASGYHAPDFVRIAGAYGLESFRIDQAMPDWREQVRAALSRSVALPLLVQIDLEQTFVYPKLEYDHAVDRPDPPLTGEEEQQVLALLRNLSEKERDAGGFTGLLRQDSADHGAYRV